MSNEIDKIVFLKKFKEEADEHIKYLNQDLLNLSEKPENKTVILDEMMRRAHTLKGSSKMMGLDEVGTVAHNLEEVLGKIREGDLPSGGEVSDLLFDCFDAISRLVNGAIIPEGAKEDISSLLGRISTLSGEKIEAAEHMVPAKHEKVASDYFGPKLEETVRVNMKKLDDLAGLAGEMVISHIRAEQRINEVKSIFYHTGMINNFSLSFREKLSKFLIQFSPEYYRDYEKDFNMLENFQVKLKEKVSNLIYNFNDDLVHLKYNASELHNQVLEIRMLPMSSIFGYFPRAIRDMAKEFGKEIKVVVKGEQTELDKKMIEQLNAPLIHILRNAVDHGIELPEDRVKAGKKSTGTISILAYSEGDSIIIEVEDDGRGINAEKLKERALDKGIINIARANQMSYKEALDLAFESGISTSEFVTDTSGRGVGLDVVRESISNLKGRLKIDSQPGKGTKMSLILPITLATFSALLLELNEYLFAIPSSVVEEVVYIKAGAIHTVEGREAVSLKSGIVPLMKLSNVLCLRGNGDKLRKEKVPVIIISYAHQRIGFMVDKLVAEQEIVMKSLGSHLKKIKGVIGATIIGTGEVVPIINVAEVVSQSKETRFMGTSGGEKKLGAAPLILVTEDSLTTRELIKSILEHNGYRVEVAQDGAEALEILSKKKFDLVVTDIQMPRMDGFLLTENIKKNEKLKSTPVIIITTMESSADKKRGIEVGAEAYILKGTFDQTNLIATIKRLVG